MFAACLKEMLRIETVFRRVVSFRQSFRDFKNIFQWTAGQKQNDEDIKDL